ncbi:MAG TPA: tripartite tricarboxylate transporter substrate binding protein [Methylomirabilota bacterium]|nr:tripartite tricarboxylate transporter substrate binding protein [Methylomirabilota bacterium]
MRLTFPWLFPLLTLASLAQAAPAAAQYPERAVTMICPFPAGGAMDIVARHLVEGMKRHFPKPVAVVNRPGAAGTIGNAEVVQAKPDGYTIGISAVAVLTVQPHRTDLPYKSPDDYEPIIKLVNLPIVFAVKADSPWKGMREFLDAARGAPGKLRVGSPGVGTILHLDLEALKADAKVDLTHVPFAGGAESVPALLGGHIEGLTAHPSEIGPHVQAGKARVLAVYEEKRNPLFPEAPTFRELGHDITLGVYYLLIAPKGTPAAALKTLHDAARLAMAEPVFVAMAKTRGYAIEYKGPDALKQELWDSYRKNEALLKQLGLGKK